MIQSPGDSDSTFQRSDVSTFQRSNVPTFQRVLITGGAGFIGSHTVDALLARGYAVRVYDNLEPEVHGPLRERAEWPAYLSPEAERIEGDVRDREALRRALEGIDAVYHLAALVGVGQSMVEVERFVDVNVRGTAVLLDILANEQHRVGKLIVPASVGIYGNGVALCDACGLVYPGPRSVAQLQEKHWELDCPQCGRPVVPQPSEEEHLPRPASVYALGKYDQERLCVIMGQTLGLPTVALRYFNVYGPRQSLTNPYTGVLAIFGRRLLEGQAPVIYEDGLQTRDLVHVADVVQANLLALEGVPEGTAVINISSGAPVTVRRIAEDLGRVLGQEIAPEIPGTYRPGDVRHSWADLARAREMLGYESHIPFSEGVRDLAEWLLQVASSQVAG